MSRRLGSISGWVMQKTQKKWYLMPPCLTLSIIRWESRVKWINPRNGVAPLPTLWCNSYWKGSLRVTINQGRQLYLYIVKSKVGDHRTFSLLESWCVSTLVTILLIHSCSGKPTSSSFVTLSPPPFFLTKTCSSLSLSLSLFPSHIFL